MCFTYFLTLILSQRLGREEDTVKADLCPSLQLFGHHLSFFLPPCEWSYSERMDKEFHQAEKHRRSRYTQGSYEPQSSQIPFPSK